MAQSHTGAEAIDEQLTILPGLGEADESDVEDLVDALTGHGPEDSAVVMSEGQAEALARRKFVGQTRQETADAMDCSKWTVDGNLTRAKANLETVDEAALAFDATGAFGLRRVDVVGSHSVDGVDEAGDQEPGDEVAAWGRLMAREAVVKVNRPAGSGYVSVETEDADIEAVEEDLDAIGYPVREVKSDAAFGNRTTIRAWERGEAPGVSGDDSGESGVESGVDEEDDASLDQPDEPRDVLLLGGEAVPAGTERISDDVLEELAADVEESLGVDLEALENGETLGTVEFDDDGFAFDPADGLEGSSDDDVEESDESGGESGDVDDEDETPGEDEEDDESDVYRCECGATFDSAGGLGGHSRYCDGVDEAEGSA